MGVSGSGKTTIGMLLSAKTGYPFYDADSFHPPENIDKMKAGEQLTDADRLPWLTNIHTFVVGEIKNRSIIIACSALKKSYRKLLEKHLENQCSWVFLKGDFNTIMNRMKNRTDHFMPTDLLQSQFDTLEVPASSIEADITLQPESIVDLIISKI
jgi:carbohydrate kinase (thermoresistant glucokinase family)